MEVVTLLKTVRENGMTRQRADPGFGAALTGLENFAPTPQDGAERSVQHQGSPRDDRGLLRPGGCQRWGLGETLEKAVELLTAA